MILLRLAWPMQSWGAEADYPMAKSVKSLHGQSGAKMEGRCRAAAVEQFSPTVRMRVMPTAALLFPT
jgi:hypothetical protein